jgi:hypothetical protein
MAIVKAVESNRFSLYGMVEYLLNDEKLLFSYGYGLNPRYAYEEMMFVKEAWNKTHKRQFKQFILSLGELESQHIPEEEFFRIAVDIGYCLANGFQVLLAVHGYTNNLHCHYLVNSVSPIDGKKLTFGGNDLYRFKLQACNILKAHGLKPVLMYGVGE